MRIITIPECTSTSTLLRQMIADNPALEHGTTLRAVSQTQGRGQRGNSWEAFPGQNLTLSVLLRPANIDRHSHFIVSEALAIAITRFLERYIPEAADGIEIKWPNDILVYGEKIAGILMENSLASDGTLLNCIAGIGLNVNQEYFTPAAPNATSMIMHTQKCFDLEEMAEEFARTIIESIDNIEVAGGREIIQQQYHSRLWRREGLHRWREPNSGEIFTATIEKVAPDGLLTLLTPTNEQRTFYFKEVFPEK